MSNNKNEIILRFERVNKDVEINTPVPFTVHFGEAGTESLNFINPLDDNDLRRRFNLQVQL